MKKTIIFGLFCMISVSVFAQNVSKSFVAKNPKETFIGALMNAGSINQDKHEFVDEPLKPIVVSVEGTSAQSVKINPRYEDMMKLVYTLYGKGELKKPKVVVPQCIEIESYDELNRLFGEAINPELLFGVTKNIIAKQHICVFDLELPLCTIKMDNHLDASTLTGDVDNLIYLNTVTVGQKTIGIIETNVALDRLMTAFFDLALHLSSGDLKGISPQTGAIFANSNIRVMFVGDKKIDFIPPAAALTLLPRLFSYNAGDDDKQQMFPIKFTAEWVKDSSEFENKF